MSGINNFNLLVSTSRFNEENAKAELWFTLLVCGIKYPIISKLSYSGLLSAFINQETRPVIDKMKKILIEYPKFYQYILKIVPIDFVCETDINIINEIVINHYRNYLEPDETFMINLKRRKSETIDREKSITKIAKNINNKVDLSNPDKIVWIEILGKKCGISFIKNSDIITVN